MIIIPYKKGLIEGIQYETLQEEAFFPNESTLQSRNKVKEYLKNFIPVAELARDGIAGKFKQSIDPHDDTLACNRGQRYSVVYFKSNSVLHFHADNDWLRIRNECFVVFNHCNIHAVMNTNTKVSYKWVAWMMNMKRSFKYPKGKEFLGDVVGVW